MSVLFSKKLLQSKYHKEFLKVQYDCVKHSYFKERKYNSYTKRLRILNNNTNQYSKVSDYSLSQFKRAQANLQKSSAIVDIAIEKGLTAVFYTLTPTAEFHPFKGRKTKKGYMYISRNKDFAFKNLDDAIQKGYRFLSNIQRNIYKRVNALDKDMYYITVFENHKSTIPHLHCLLFVKPEHIEDVENIFNRNVKYYKLSQVDFQVLNNSNNFFTNASDSVNIVASYIRKYMFKTLSTNKDNQDTKNNKNFQSRFLDGWLKHHKIRQFRMSRLPLNLETYQKVYYSLPKEYKDNLVIKLTEKKQSLFRYIMDNIQVEKIIYDVNTDTFKLKQLHTKQRTNKEFKVLIQVQKSKVYDKYYNFKNYSNKVIQYKIIHYDFQNEEQTELYNKNNYQLDYIDNKKQGHNNNVFTNSNQR